MPAQALSFLGRIGAAAEGAPGLAVNAAALFQAHSRLADLPYGAQPRRRLDVYLPPPSRSPHCVVVFLYGGSWSSGSKDIYRFLGAALATRGVLAVIPDYRLYPAVRYPAFVEDAALALRWARDNAARFGADASRLFLMGHSAGAHIAAMLAFERRWLAAAGLDARRNLAGVIGLAGPYDFELDTDLLKGVFGGPENRAHTQPLAHVTGDAPPLLLATGEADRTVAPRHTHALAAAVRAAGGEVKTLFYPRLGHREIIGAFSPLFRFLAPVAADVSDFVSTKRAPGANTSTGDEIRRGVDERI